MPFGAEVQADGGVRFHLWAPAHAAVSVEIDGGELLRLRPVGEGWHELATGRARPGSLYIFVLPDGSRVPDPASRHQPRDVHGPSEVIDPTAYEWNDAGWQGRNWEEAVIYELHVGAFTPGGTFAAAIGRLDHLAALGVTAIELMPVGDFPGRRNWGYDGVLPYAPDAAYGRPEALKALVDAAHRRGLMALLDVVYNHFGPEGAYFGKTAPQFFTERHKTPWGAAINMDGESAATVRQYFIHNALYWLEEFHFDGLRLDAVHAIRDDSPKHFLTELAERVRAAFPQRAIHLILENNRNEASRLVRDADGAPRRFTAQWNDDVHHALHAAATGERAGYYADYVGRTDRLGRALAEGFAFQGETMPYRGRPRGEPSAALPPTAFVAFAQNHDQIGNRAFGERLVALAAPEAVRAVGAVYLLLPQIPLLFMGEEWGAEQPFPFFCDFAPPLSEAVSAGRREEFARFPEFADPAARQRIPDPAAEATYLSAKLAWDDVGREPYAGWLEWHRRILTVRRREIVPLLAGMRAGGEYRVIGDSAVTVHWRSHGAPSLVVESSPPRTRGSRGSCTSPALDSRVRGNDDPIRADKKLRLDANLSSVSVTGFPPVSGRVIWREGPAGDDGSFGPFAVRWSIDG